MHGALIVESMLVLSVVYLIKEEQLIFLHLKLLATVYVVMLELEVLLMLLFHFTVSGNKKKMDSSFHAFTFLLRKKKKKKEESTFEEKKMNPRWSFEGEETSH